MIHAIVVLVLVIPYVVNSASSEKRTEGFQCPDVCNGNNPHVNLGVLRCHRYEFAITHRVSSAAHEVPQSGITIRGTAVISGGTDCTYELKLEDVEAFELASDGFQVSKPTTAAVLEAKVAYFGFEEGKVTGFCPAETDDPFAWNVKAAILSHLQAKLESLKLPSESVEEDVSGRCLTRYDIVRSDEAGITFEKRKPIAGCADRYDLITRLDGVSDETPSELSKNQMLSGEQECRVSFKYSKPVSEVSCRESIVLSGPVDYQWKKLNEIEVITKLKLISSKSSGSLTFDRSQTFVQTSLRHRESYVASKSDQSTSSEGVMQILRGVALEGRTASARDFLMLVDYIRRSKSMNLSALKQFAFSETALGLLFDAAIHAQTEESVEFLEWCLDGTQFTFPVGYMSFLPSPSLQFIKKIERALSKVSHKTLTMVTSNLLRTYCKSHPHCEEEEGVKELMRSIELKVLNYCKLDQSEDLNKVLDSLRAIGNLGRVSNKSSMYAALAGCLASPTKHDLIIRVTAAEVFRGFPTDSDVDDILLRAFANATEDVEVRIQAYRSWARHLTQEKLSQLHFLDQEPDKQVTSYILSHLNGIRNSKDPAKQDESFLLGNIDTPLMKLAENHTPNIFKQSFYKEKHVSGSQFGGGVDTTVVYGPQSIFPRYVDLNFTFDVLGHSINVLELAYHSIYSESLSNYVYGFGDKYPLSQGRSGIDALPKVAEMYDQWSPDDRKPRLTVRLFGRDIGYYDDIENPDQLARLLETRPNFVGINETVAFSTIGGIVVQINHLLAIHQDITYYHGLNAKYGVNVVVDAMRSVEVGLNAYEGLLGYSTEDDVQVDVPILFTVDILDRIRELTGFEVGLFGVDSKMIAFKLSRSVKSISPTTGTAIILSGGKPHLLRSSPSLLKILIGLDASLSTLQDPSTGLITGYVAEVERFDGLFISFIKEKPSFSELFQSIKFEVKRYRVRKSGFLGSSELIKFSYLTREMKGEWFTLASLKMPWNSTYSCSINYNSEGEFSGDLNIAGWETNITGNMKQVGPSDYEVTTQLIRPDFSLSVNQQVTIGKLYVLAAESTSKLLPFIFKSTTEFATPTKVRHASELQLPTDKKAILLETQISWKPRNYGAMFSLQVNKGNSEKRWTGEIAAINNIGVPHLPVYTPIYNYSLFLSTESDQTPNTWALGSSAMGISDDSSSWIVKTQHWYGVYEAEFGVGYKRRPFHVSGLTYTFDGAMKRDNERFLTINGNVNVDTLSVIDGHFNASLHDSFMCWGKTYKLSMYLDNGGPEKKIEGEALCGDKWVYRFKGNLDVAKQHHSFHLLKADNFELRIESPYALKVVDGKIRATMNSSVYIGTKHRYDIYRSLAITKNEIDDRCHVKRISDSAITATTALFLSNAPKFRLRVDLPTTRGFSLDSGFEMGREAKIVVDTRALLTVDSIKRGLEFHISSGLGGFLPITFNGSVHGPVDNKSTVVNLNVQGDQKGPEQADLFVQTHLDDEFIFKLIKSHEKESNSGELSLLCSLHPGTPSQNFTGFLYKTQVSWTFTKEVFRVEQQGEWNGNRATPPGMPFRYGIRRISNSDAGGGEIQVYAEDTNMGKAFGYEMLEGLLMYEMEDAKKSSFGLEGNVLLNWRKYLGRGVIGSQATLKAQVDKSMKRGNVEISWELPDDNQTLIVATANYEFDANKFFIISKASLGETQVHRGKLEVQRKASAWEVELDAKLHDYALELEYEGEFSSNPFIDMGIGVMKDKRKLLIAVVVTKRNRHPRLFIYFSPIHAFKGFKRISLRLSSQTMPHEMAIGNFSVKGHFRTEPIVGNCEFSVRTDEDLRLIETSLSIKEANGPRHREHSLFQLSEDGSQLAINVDIDSPYLLNGPIKVSAKHDCSSDVEMNYDYDLKCSKLNNYTLVLKNTKASKGISDYLVAGFNRISAGTTLIEVRIDSKHAILLNFTHLGKSTSDIKLILQINDKVVGKVEGGGSLVRNENGFKFDLNGKLSTGNNLIASMKLKLSNMPTLRAIDMVLNSTTETLGSHTFILKADAGYLLNLLSNENMKENYSQIKTYLLQIDDHAVGLELISSSASMMTFSLPSLPIPAVFRLAYDLKQEGAWRTVIQVYQPIQIEMRTLLGSKEEIFLALSNKVNIIDTVGDLRITNLLGGEKLGFIKSGCGNGMEDCISIVVGGDASRLDQQNLLFSVVLPRFGHIESIIVETEFADMTLQALFITSKDREVGFGAWIDREQNAVVTEIAWNRRKEGLLLATFGKQFFALQDSKRRIDFGREGKVFYIRTKNLQSGAVTKYLESTFRSDDKLELDSYLLKGPVTLVFIRDSKQKTLRLHRGRADALSTPVVELLIIETPLDQLRTRITITLNRNGRKLVVDTIRDESVIRRTINSTISVDGKNGQMYFEHIPGRGVYLNFNNNVIFGMTRALQPNVAEGNIELQYRGGTVRLEAELRATANPMKIFASVRTAQAEAVLQGNGLSLMDVAGDLQHTYNEGKNILDAEVSTYLNEQEETYNLNAYWRAGALVELLFGGAKSVTAPKVPFFVAEFVENLINLVVEEVSELKDLFDQTALEETWLSIVQSLKDLILSFDDPSVTGLVNVSNTTLAEKIETIHNHIISALDRINELFDNLDPRKLYNLEQVSKALRCLDSWNQKYARQTKTLFWMFGRSNRVVQTFVDKITDKLSILKSVTEDAADTLNDACNQLSQNITEFKLLRDSVSTVVSEAKESCSHVIKCGKEMVGPLLESFSKTFYNPLSIYEKMMKNSFTANLTKITVSSTTFLPLWVQTAAGVACTRFVGLPLTKSDLERRLSKLLLAASHLEDAVKTAVLISQQLRNPSKSKSWLFLDTAGKSHIITFDKRLISFEANTDEVLVLINDALRDEIAVTVEFGADGAQFTHYRNRESITITEQGLIKNGDRESDSNTAEQVGGANLTVERTAVSWQLHDGVQDVALIFYRQERILLVEAGGRWYGRLDGALKLSHRGGHPDITVSDWLKSKGSRKIWLKNLRDYCQNSAVMRKSVESLFNELESNEEECPRAPFMQLAFISNPFCEGDNCGFSRGSVYDAYTALASCLGKGYTRNPCYNARQR
ncbi:Apolipophorin [Taenia crassiceps]|uniref:Apolipophorin n=1 Tax=Taenia crassiceps TaxID=6207 RepID=A0ABR4QE21_9CEST